MLRPRAHLKLSLASACILVTLLATSAYGQSSTSQPKPDAEAVADASRRGELEKEVAEVKAENAAVREQLRRMEEQQKALTETIEGMQRRLEGPATAEAQPAGKPVG